FEVLSAEPLTREELIEAVGAGVGSRAVRERLSSGWGELLKPAAWAGVLLQGPPRGSSVTFVRADAWVDGWRCPDPEEGGADVLRSYLYAFGPATPQHVADWWARQPASKVRPWFERLGEEIAPVAIEGDVLWALAADVHALETTRPSDAVRLLGNFDQYILTAGSGSASFVPAEHKAKVSRTGGWISRLVVRGGRVAGVWEPEPTTGEVTFDLWEPVPADALDAELDRIGLLAGHGPNAGTHPA
ncbi:MAG: DNA glycosylase AlkZ-like family protein, partial [Actinomycetota bacterium]